MLDSLRTTLTRHLRRKLQGYSGQRPDILRLIICPPQRILDVGCGAGMLGSQLRELYATCRTIGVEPDAQRAALAAHNFDNIVVGQIDDPVTVKQLQQQAPFDLIICGDVLEHLPSPDRTLRALSALLTPDGHLITSLPNVRHLSTFVDLFMLGTWPQRDRGIHDRTHLHFYARRDILRMGADAGLVLLRERRNLRLFEAHSWSMFPAKLLDFWPLRAFFTFQYLHLWRREQA